MACYLLQNFCKYNMSTNLESKPTKFVTCNEIWSILVHINLLLIYVDVLEPKQLSVLKLIPVSAA